MSFIKLYNDNDPDGYISVKDIKYFDIEYNQGDYSGDEHHLVRACTEEDESVRDGYQVSPRIDSGVEAYLFLDSIIEKLRGSNG